eukprot:13166-Heterococcus_DN1.PRE.2
MQCKQLLATQRFVRVSDWCQLQQQGNTICKQQPVVVIHIHFPLRAMRLLACFELYIRRANT